MKYFIITGIAISALLSLTACSTNGEGGAAGPPAHPAGLLAVHIGISGGPAKPNGEAALNNSPVRNIKVSAIDTSGHRWFAVTGRDGIAVFDVAPGQYTVVPNYCGDQHHQASVVSNHTAHVQVSCDVP